MNVYDFSVKTQGGSEVALSDYKGKVLLIVNTETRFIMSALRAAATETSRLSRCL